MSVIYKLRFISRAAESLIHGQCLWLGAYPSLTPNEFTFLIPRPPYTCCLATWDQRTSSHLLLVAASTQNPVLAPPTSSRPNSLYTCCMATWDQRSTAHLSMVAVSIWDLVLAPPTSIRQILSNHCTCCDLPDPLSRSALSPLLSSFGEREQE